MSRRIAPFQLSACLLLGALFLACSPASQDQSAADNRVPSPLSVQPLPAGTAITIITTQVLDSRLQPSGFEFTGRLDRNLLSPDGAIVARRGSDVTGVLGLAVAGSEEQTIEAASAAPVRSLALVGITINGRAYPLQASFYRLATANVTAKTVRTAGSGALVGGLLGGRRGAGLGATVGAFAGVSSTAANSASYFRIPIGTRLTFRLDLPFEP